MRKTNGQEESPAPSSYIRAQRFETVHFYDAKAKRQIIILYALGEDGIVREFTNGKWVGFPIPVTEEPVASTEMKA